MKSMPKILTVILVAVLALSLIPITADNPASANPTGQAWTPLFDFQLAYTAV